MHVRSMTLVRHGRTAYNAAHRLQGQIDIPLDQTGQWQVTRTGEALKTLYVDQRPATHPVVVSSDLGRALATAHAFADRLSLDVATDERVRERSFGEWEGVSVEELAERYPEDYYSWTQFAGGELKYGAEPASEVGRRGVEALNDWSTRYDTATDLYVFSHGAWISLTLQTLLGMNLAHSDYASMMSMRNAHWARLVPLEMDDGTLRWRLTDYNHGPAEADTPQWEHMNL